MKAIRVNLSHFMWGRAAILNLPRVDLPCKLLMLVWQIVTWHMRHMSDTCLTYREQWNQTFFASRQQETDTSGANVCKFCPPALQHEHRENLVGRYADSPYVIGQMISFNLSGIARSWEGSTPLRHSLNFQMLILGRTMQGWSIEPAAGYSLHKNMSKPSSPWMQSEPLNFLASVSKNHCFLTPPIVLKRLCICKYPYMTVRSQRQLDWYLSDVRDQTMCPMYKKNQRDHSFSTMDSWRSLMVLEIQSTNLLCSWHGRTTCTRK